MENISICWLGPEYHAECTNSSGLDGSAMSYLFIEEVGDKEIITSQIVALNTNERPPYCIDFCERFTSPELLRGKEKLLGLLQCEDGSKISVPAPKRNITEFRMVREIVRHLD